MPQVKMVTVTFHPQAWVNDYAVEVDPEGPTTWQVPASRVKGLEPDTYPSDDLRHDPAAPQWVKDWHGPFYIDWEGSPMPRHLDICVPQESD